MYQLANEIEKQVNLQDAFLNLIRKERIPVTVHVINGYQLNHLMIVSFDNYAILAECGDKQMLLYKHAISSITLEKPNGFHMAAPQKEKKDETKEAIRQ